MRIIGGVFKGRRLEPPMQQWTTRPTTDRAKESLLNILLNRMELEGVVAMDLFAGTGSIGYELLSQGAARVDFVEKYRPCTQFIHKTLAALQCADRAQVWTTDVLSLLQSPPPQPYDLIFADPPYQLPQLPSLPEWILRQQKWLKTDGLLIIEHDIRTNFEKDANFASHRQYGETIFSFFS